MEQKKETNKNGEICIKDELFMNIIIFCLSVCPLNSLFFSFLVPLNIPICRGDVLYMKNIPMTLSDIQIDLVKLV